jgi:ABC-type lipopolysaccharide export system ATPase subunit
LVLQGDANDLLHEDQVRKIYLGEDIMGEVGSTLK